MVLCARARAGVVEGDAMDGGGEVGWCWRGERERQREAAEDDMIDGCVIML